MHKAFRTRALSNTAMLYRVIYEIQDSELIILGVKIAHRRDVYKNF